MTISANIVADSLSEDGIRLTTFLLRYPRFVHAELMTHRVFSRNASSSRAIPVKKLVADIRRDPAMFEFWGRNEKGMQASAELEGFALWLVQRLWLAGMWIMTTLALWADALGAHKQTVNRMVEPWSHITVVVTSTQYANWFALRDHPDAMPEIMWLARHMNEQYLHSQHLKKLKLGQWHLPFVDGKAEVEINRYLKTINPNREYSTRDLEYLEIARQVSVSRCARTSYRTHDNRVATIDEEVNLYKRLIDRAPLHASPTEHQATPDRKTEFLYRLPGEVSFRQESRWTFPGLHGNLIGWVQYRKMLKGENVADEPHIFDYMAFHG